MAGISAREAARRVGCADSTAVEHFRKLRATKDVPDLVNKPKLDPIEEAQKTLERSRALKAEKELLLDVAGEKSLRAFLASLAKDVAAEFDAPPRYQSPPDRKGVSTETGLLNLSDWHAYEVVKPERVQGSMSTTRASSPDESSESSLRQSLLRTVLNLVEGSDSRIWLCHATATSSVARFTKPSDTLTRLMWLRRFMVAE